MSSIRRLRTFFRRAWQELPTKAPIVKHALVGLYWLPIGIAFTQYFYVPRMVTGRSMQPTLNPDTSAWRDIVIFDRFSVGMLRKYNRGDLVAVRSPVENKLLIKRIIAVEGDVVKTLPPYPDKEVLVPRGRIWIEGDESFRTDDSNRFGPVPMALVDSRLAFIVWPLDRWGPVREPSVPQGSPSTP
ncbi:hypothetical protein PLICRDRAFT_128814, partial [Plicaturopsis crispa FD-325 SS-3]